MKEEKRNGRPPIYETVDEMLPVLQKWIDEVKAGKEVPTVTGLTLALGFESKDTLYAYRDKPGFSYPIKRALLIVENGYECDLRAKQPTGPIFALKNMGWKDSSQVENTVSMTNFNVKDLVSFDEPEDTEDQ